MQMHIVKTGIAFVLLVFCLGSIVGCSRYAGNQEGSEPIVGSQLRNYYLFQYDTFSGEYDEAKKRPLFAIFWQRPQSPSSSEGDGSNMIVALDGHTIYPSRSKLALYALQPDYSLKELPATKEEIEHLFSLVRDISNMEPGLGSDPVWQEKVQPSLKVVMP